MHKGMTALATAATLGLTLLAAGGCQSSEKSHGEHPSASEHPNSEHPNSEHPDSEHPDSEHPNSEHPNSEHPG